MQAEIGRRVCGDSSRRRGGAATLLGATSALTVLACCLAFTPAAMATNENGEACPNEASPGFRPYLPDCRAYEQVSPVFKAGTQLGLTDLSADGSHVIASSLGVFARSGSDTGGIGSSYELSRSPTGWDVAELSPPASSFPAQSLLAASPDFGQTLWEARSPSESNAAENLYIREPDGVMAEIGPILPPSLTLGPPSGESEGFLYSSDVKFLEASDDLSYVVFDLLKVREKGLAWPGDTTFEERSLYQYSGRGQSHPELVGVSDGSTVIDGKTLPAGQLISSCETYLGSPTEQDLYNAVSADGATVFFTAKGCSRGIHEVEPEVDELYARLNQAETVPVSEPSAFQCSACNTTVKEPAEFAGASRDGSKVFFLTAQQLLPGASGINLYEYDFDQPAGEHVNRVSVGSTVPDVLGVARVSEDGSHVYFVAAGRLTGGPREGDSGSCIAELSAAEQDEEALAQAEEEKSEPVTTGARCRPKEGQDNLYVFERDASYPAGRVAFIATLRPGDIKDWEAKDTHPVQATPDGRFLVFQSTADLTPDGTGSVPPVTQVFEYDAATEALVRVSRGANDYQPQGTEAADAQPSKIPFQTYTPEEISPAQPGTELVVSEDGAIVAFESSAALTAAALPASKANAESVYEYHNTVADNGSIREGEVSLISDGVNTTPANLFGLDASGDDLFFKTSDRLVPQDTDTQYDIYDARVEGGFPAPDPPPGCEECNATPLIQSLVTPSPLPGASGSAPGNLAPVNSSAPAMDGPVGSHGGETPAQIRAEQLVRALKTCRRYRAKTKRGTCERSARERYGTKRPAKKPSRRAQ